MDRATLPHGDLRDKKPYRPIALPLPAMTSER
jgi:hypothetical protein